MGVSICVLCKIHIKIKNAKLSHYQYTVRVMSESQVSCKTKQKTHTIIVDDCSYQPVLLKHWEMLKGSRFAKDVTAFQAITSCY